MGLLKFNQMTVRMRYPAGEVTATTPRGRAYQGRDNAAEVLGQEPHPERTAKIEGAFTSCTPFGNIAETMIWAFIQCQVSHDAPNPRKIGASAKKHGPFGCA